MSGEGKEKYNYKIGFTFTGSQRDLVQEVCETLIMYHRYARKEIFYDDWHKEKIAGCSSDIVLQEIYHDQCDCIVVFLSEEYKDNHWTGEVEWESIKTLIHSKKKRKLLLFAADSVDINSIDGLDKKTDIFIPIKDMNVDQIAFQIHKFYKDRCTIYKEDDIPDNNAEAHKNKPESKSHRFKIGIVFSGKYRELTISFAEKLLNLGFAKEEIFIDEWHKELIQGIHSEADLKDIYQNQCDCVVALISPDHDSRNWTGGIEWSAVSQLISGTGKVIVLGIDNQNYLPQIQSEVKDIDNLTPSEIASYISENYEFLNPQAGKKNQQTKEKKINSKSPSVEERMLIHNFTNKIHQLYNKDGMMRCLYQLFQKYIDENAFTYSELSLLYIIQDEYEKVYDQDYKNKKVTDTVGLDRMLNDEQVIKMENNLQTHPLIITYLHFVKADELFFTKDYDKAIQQYQEADAKIKAQYKGTELSDIDKERCAYLQNAIAWSYRLRGKAGDNNSAGDLSKAIRIYRKLFDEYPDINNHSFSCKYRRNYGACLEIAGQYIEAIKQYEKAIDNYSEADNNGNLSEFKLFITYCSAMMKYWDEETGKVSGQWIENTRRLFNKAEENYLTDENMTVIDARLDYADLIIRKHDETRHLPNVYRQRSKLLTYKMITASEKAERDRYIHEIKLNLMHLQDVSGDANTGLKYIKRDFYYALCEVTRDRDEKMDCFMTAWNVNESLEGAGDSMAFEEMLRKKKAKLK